MSAIRNTPLTPYPPIQRGKEREGGLLLPADYSRLPVYGPSGELLLHPNGVAGIDYLWRDSTGRAHLHSGSELYLEATSALYLGANAFYDSASALWNRVNIAKAAHLLVVRDDPVPQLEFYTVAAGANPITWVGPANLTRALVALLAGAVSTATANTLALRNASGFLGNVAWNGLSFAANWSDFNTASHPACAYRKNAHGDVEFKGMAKKGIALALPDTIGTLPSTHWPLREYEFAVASNGGYTTLKIDTAGNVVILAGGNATWTALNGVAFDPLAV